MPVDNQQNQQETALAVSILQTARTVACEEETARDFYAAYAKKGVAPSMDSGRNTSNGRKSVVDSASEREK